MLRNKIMWFGTMTINWVNIKKDSVTLQFVMNRGMSLYSHTMNILNDLFLRLFRRKISESKNYNDFIVYNRLTLTYEELSYVYTYLSLKYRQKGIKKTMTDKTMIIWDQTESIKNMLWKYLIDKLQLYMQTENINKSLYTLYWINIRLRINCLQNTKMKSLCT